MLLCLGEPPTRFLFYLHFIFVSSFHFWSSFCCCSSFVHVLNFISRILCHVTLASQAREGLHQLWDLLQLLSIAFAFASTASATVFSGHFLHTGVFYLALFHRHFPSFIKASLGTGSSSLKFSGLHIDPWNTDLPHLFVWLTVTQKLHIKNDSVLNSTIYSEELLVAKSLVYRLLTCSKSNVKAIKNYFKQE